MTVQPKSWWQRFKEAWTIGPLTVTMITLSADGRNRVNVLSKIDVGDTISFTDDHGLFCELVWLDANHFDITFIPLDHPARAAQNINLIAGYEP